MDFSYTRGTVDLRARVQDFMGQYVYPSERRFFREARAAGPYGHAEVIDELKQLAREEQLWNLFLPEELGGPPLGNLGYAPVCEVMGRSLMAPEVFNCSAPDTGNMHLLAQFGSSAQKDEWLEPLLDGKIRSAFAMTEPEVPSSDATQIRTSITRAGDDYIVTGRKWFTTNATDPRCRLLVVMGVSDPDESDRHRRHSMVLVPKDAPGVTVVRPLPIFGFEGVLDKASEVTFDAVRVPGDSLLLGHGRGFEMAQARLGPGRVHHCMRLIGLAERALERFCRRAEQRTPFDQPLAAQTVTLERIAEARVLIEQARLLTLKAAWSVDQLGSKEARAEIAMIKIVVPTMACRVIDWAIQAFGGAGVTNDFGLAAAYVTARYLRIADGPDEVHRNQLARMELAAGSDLDPAFTGSGAEVLGIAAALEEGRSLRDQYRPTDNVSWSSTR